LKGFYKSRYINYQGENKYHATTQMEPISARLMLFCLDEPERKSIFKINVETDIKYQVLSNMPEESVSYLGNDTKLITFMETPKMST